MTSKPIPHVERLAESSPILRRGALGMAALGLVAVACEIVLLDLDLKDVLSGGLLAAVAFALLH